MKKIKVSEKAKNIINICCIVCISILVLFSSFIMVFAGVGACTNTAKADSVVQTYAYEGNSFYLPTNTFTGSYPYDGTGGVRPFLLQFDYRISFPYTEQGDISPVLDFRAYTDAAYPSLSGLMSDGDTWYQSIDDGYFRVDMLRPDFSNTIYLKYRGVAGYVAKYGYVELRYENGFNGNVKRIEFSSTDFTDGADLSNNYYVFFYYLRLFDDNNKYFQFEFTSSFNPVYVSRQALTFDTRTYYTSNSFTDNQYYQNGFNDGEEYGRLQNQLVNSEQLQAEYNRGKDDGITLGKNLGYQEAIDGNLTAGSFFANMLSILDVPLFGFISLGQILMLGVAVSLVMIALKLFAGG